MNSSYIFSAIQKIAVSTLCIVSATCIFRLAKKAIGTMQSIDNVCEGVINKVLTPTGKLLNKCTYKGISLDISTDAEISFSKNSTGRHIKIKKLVNDNLF